MRQEYGVEVRSIPRPAAPDKPLTAQEQKKRSRANWWYYNWGIVAVAAMVIVGVAYVAHGLLTTVDPDYTVAVVTAEALPDEAVQRLQTALADYAEDANGDGTVVVQVNNYTWSADAWARNGRQSLSRGAASPPFPGWNWAATTLPPMAARLLISRAALPGTAWQCLMLQMRCGRRSIRKQKRPSVLFLFMWYSIHRKIDGGIPP